MIYSGISSDLFNAPAEEVVSLKKSIGKKSKNICAKNINNDVLVDSGLCTSSVTGTGIALKNSE